MNLSTFMMPLHPVGKPWPLSLKEDREAIILADRLGYSEAFVGEHVTDAAETVTSCMMFLASLAHDTRHIKLGTGTINLPNSHPAHVAAQAAMLDNILEGRFIMGISPGGLMSDAEAFGNYGRDRMAMFVEGINMVLDIWAGEAPYNLKGQFWEVTTEKTMIAEIGTGIMLKPYQQPHPPIVGTVVAPFSKGVIAMAERGWKPISANFLLPQWVKTHWDSYVQGKHNIGQVASPADWSVAKCIFVADDDATAQRYGYGEDGPYHHYFKQLIRKLVGFGNRGNLFKADQSMPDEMITADYVNRKLTIAGTVNSVVDQILAFREEVGDFGTLVYASLDWKDPALGKRSMELMAEKVMPAVNAAIASGKTARAA